MQLIFCAAQPHTARERKKIQEIVDKTVITVYIIDIQ